MKLDRLDAKILNLLQQSSRTGSEEIGAVVGLSPTAVQRRIKRLRDAGVIESEVAVVNPKAVGLPLAMFVLVTLERERADIVDRFKQSIRHTREVMNGYYVTGEADFAIVVTAHSMEEYELFTRKFFYENPDIRSFKTMVIMDRIKTGFSLPIDPALFE
jgi:Lrp/AsnC family leucine-responsive transcriptional regulator